MDWITFIEKKQAELMNTGNIMDDVTFITHLLNTLPQTEYEEAILVIKDKLRKGSVEIPEIEQVLEDKYQAMKHAKGWEEEEDDNALFASPSNKKDPRKHSKDAVDTVENWDMKQQIVTTRKASQPTEIENNLISSRYSKKKGENENALVMNEMELSHLGENIFIGYSAATSHMTSNKMGVYNLVPIDGSVMIGNGKSISCTHKGKLDVLCKHNDRGLMIELFKTTRASMTFDRMIPSGSSWLMGIRFQRVFDQAHSAKEPGKTIFISKFHQITGHTGEHLLKPTANYMKVRLIGRLPPSEVCAQA